MSILTLKNASKSYGETKVLTDINLEVAEGEFVAIVGFSGSGKTTLMNILSGLETVDGGEALYRGQPITEPGQERGLVFQSYSLMPWLTVTGNVVGTLRFTAPEQFQGEGDERSDVYSLGLTLYELSTLTPAYSASDRKTLMKRVITGSPIPPRQINLHS